LRFSDGGCYDAAAAVFHEPGQALNARSSKLRRAILTEWFLAVGLASAAAFLMAGDRLPGAGAALSGNGIIFVWLFVVILGSALSVVRHADHVAEVLGEPYGTLILTLAVTTVEVISISAVMLHGENNPTLVRDTLFAIVMIILGGMVGGTLLLGGWRHREQSYNLQGANAYLGVVIPLTVLTLTLPDFTVTTPGPTLSIPQQIFLFTMSIGLYATFLAIQTGRHRGYFISDGEEHGKPPSLPGARQTLAWHAALLIANIALVVLLAEQLAQPMDYFIETLKVPPALGGVAIAMLVATPEAVAAMRSAMANQLQRSINISLGSVLATIGLTVPTMLAVSYGTRHEIYLGLERANDVLLLLTLVVCIVTFASGRTNILQGAVHAVLFAAFVMLIFQG
jgi:Ca2+:H+ antiporter